jgi:hypothetical protein
LKTTAGVPALAAEKNQETIRADKKALQTPDPQPQ